MQLRVNDDASVEEAEAIARMMATHAETDVEVYVGDSEDDIGPTEREEEPASGTQKVKITSKHEIMLDFLYKI